MKTHWGIDYQFPMAWKAQLYQESLCDPDAVSHAGARGLAQFMPATWREMEARFDIDADPHDDIAIDFGAYYMAKQMKKWSWKRPTYEKWRLGLASYNAGFGNILKAQAECDDERMWRQIKLCLPMVTGRHARETKTYVERIERWWQALAVDEPWELPAGLWQEAVNKKFEDIKSEYAVTRCFSGRSWGTYWQLWNGWVTADHVHLENKEQSPDFASTVVHRSAGDIDMVYHGSDMPSAAPRRPWRDEPIYILGYPAASDKVSARFATVRLKRQTSADPNYNIPTYAATVENRPDGLFQFGSYFEPVIGGMSGGLVLSTDNEPLGVLVGDTGMADYQGDGINDYFLDFVSIADFQQYMSCKLEAENETDSEAAIFSCLAEINYTLDGGEENESHALVAGLPFSNSGPTSLPSESSGMVCDSQQ